MGKLTKERVLKVCKNVNEGMSPTTAARLEGMPLAKHLIESGILYKDSITGKWQGRIRIHDERYNNFIKLYYDYQKDLYRKRYPLRENTTEPKAKRSTRKTRKNPKAGVFRRIWNSIFG